MRLAVQSCYKHKGVKKVTQTTAKDVKVIRPTKGLYGDKKLRVAAYCRVSTSSDDQENSFIAQVKYYNDYLRLADNM